MKRIKHLKIKIAITLLYIVCLIILYYLGAECIYISLFGIPCPGCGMTRAVLSLLKFKVLQAFYYHPMVFFLPITYLYILFDGKLFKKPVANKVFITLLCLGYVVSYIFKLVTFIN